MDFFNNVGKKLGSAAKSATKKSEELVEITKINLSIGNEEDKIKKLFTEMGKELYSLYASGEFFDESINGKCEEIKAVDDNIEALKEKVKSLKGHNTNLDSVAECNSECCTEKKPEANYRLDDVNKKDSE
jgi:vacuolar-type H+-ATPase subunit I/STV1